MGNNSVLDSSYSLFGADPSAAFASVVSPASADSIVGPPPDGVPDHQPGQGTPLTGNLTAAPKQAVAKNLDTQQGRSAYTGVSNPPNGGFGATTSVQPAQVMRPAQTVQPAQNGMQPAQINPDPGGFARPGGTSPAMPVLPQSTLQPAKGPSQLDLDQNKLNYLTNSGSGISQIKNGFGRTAARIGDGILSAVAPGIEPLVGGTEGHHNVLVGRQQAIVGNDQAQQQAAAQTADTASQTAEREAQGRKADALAQADAPQPLSKEQAGLLGHPELEGEPMTQRALTTLGAASIRGTAQESTGAGHDAASITRTGMRDDTSTANNAATNTSREAITAARDKTQTLLGQLRASVSTGNNERNNQTHLTTSGMRSATGSAAGQPGNYKVPADVTKRAALANNVQENAGEVSKLLDGNPDIVGAIAGRYTNAEQMIGNDNPAISALGTRIHNIALAANGAHGVRSAEAVHATERELLNNFHNGPNAIKGALNATTSSVQTFLDDEKNYRSTGGRVAPSPAANTGPAIPAGNIRVQLPNGQSGHISAAQKDKFLKDHPGAKVL